MQGCILDGIVVTDRPGLDVTDGDCERFQRVHGEQDTQAPLGPIERLGGARLRVLEGTKQMLSGRRACMRDWVILRGVSVLSSKEQEMAAH